MIAITHKIVEKNMTGWMKEGKGYCEVWQLLFAPAAREK